MNTPRKSILIPVEPTSEILQAMAAVTYLRDGSEIEMARRYAGILHAIDQQRKQKKKT